MIATNEHWVDAKGEKKSKTDWHKIVVFRPTLVDFCQRFLKKGANLVIEGKLSSRKYLNADGVEIRTNEIVIGSGYGFITNLSPLPPQNNAIAV